MNNAALHLIFNPRMAEWTLWLMAVAIIALLTLTLLRRVRGGVWRALLLALIFLILLNPALIAEKRVPLKDTTLIVIDDSASMKLGPRRAQTDKALTALKEKLAAFDDLDVQELHVPGREESDLFSAVTRKLGEIPAGRLAGVIMLSDGQIHDGANAPTLKAPLHALIAGAHNESDRRLSIVQNPGYGMMGQSVSVTLRIDDDNLPETATAPLTIRSDDGQTQTVNLPIGKPVAVELNIAHSGKNLFAFTTPTLPNEITPANNSASAAINGIRDRLRVLLVSGSPHAGERVWRNFLKSDPAVDLVHFTILRDPQKFDATPQNELALIVFPVQELFETKLHSFDLVIFDRFNRPNLLPANYLDNIAAYVRDGGALLVAGSTESANEFSGNSLMEQQSAVTALMPTIASGKILTGEYKPKLTALGAKHPVTATLAPYQDSWGPWLRQIETMPDKGSVLMSGMKDAPLLVLDHAGKGRVAQFLSDQFWLWSRAYAQGGPQNELLRRTAHWLMQEPELEESALSAQAVPDDTGDGWRIDITERNLKDAQRDITLTAPNNSASQITAKDSDKNGNLRGSTQVREAGLYQLSDGDLHTLVMAGAGGTPEFSAMIATDETVKPAVKASAGGVIWLTDTDGAPTIKRTDLNGSQSGSGWIGLQRNGGYRVVGSEQYPLWPAGVALALLLACALMGWWREGKN